MPVSRATRQRSRSTRCGAAMMKCGRGAGLGGQSGLMVRFVPRWPSPRDQLYGQASTEVRLGNDRTLRASASVDSGRCALGAAQGEQASRVRPAMGSRAQAQDVNRFGGSCDRRSRFILFGRAKQEDEFNRVDDRRNFQVGAECVVGWLPGRAWRQSRST